MQSSQCRISAKTGRQAGPPSLPGSKLGAFLVLHPQRRLVGRCNTVESKERRHLDPVLLTCCCHPPPLPNSRVVAGCLKMPQELGTAQRGPWGGFPMPPASMTSATASVSTQIWLARRGLPDNHKELIGPLPPPFTLTQQPCKSPKHWDGRGTQLTQRF